MKNNLGSGKVTIITPTYKRLKSLKEAVQCVLNQTYSNWEQIIVSDGYDARVEKFVRNLNDSRIRYFCTERTNFFGNFQRNSGLKHARGEFVLFLDDDNLIYPDYLSKMLDKFNSKKIGYVICSIKNYDKITLTPRTPFVRGKIDTLNFMIRRELIERVGGWPGKKYSNQIIRKGDAADFELINSVGKISKANFVDEVLGEHRRLAKDKFMHYILGKFEFLDKLRG